MAVERRAGGQEGRGVGLNYPMRIGVNICFYSAPSLDGVTKLYKRRSGVCGVCGECGESGEIESAQVACSVGRLYHFSFLGGSFSAASSPSDF